MTGRPLAIINTPEARALPQLGAGAACSPLAALFDEASHEPDVARQMRALCARCTVYTECKAQAPDPAALNRRHPNYDTHGGFMAGMTRRERIARIQRAKKES